MAFLCFFVVVPTNTVYQVVATFKVAEETTSAITEAITKIKEWNAEWQPQTWMTDCATSEISAIEAAFSGMMLSCNNIFARRFPLTIGLLV